MEIENRLVECGEVDLEAIVEIARAMRPDGFESVASLNDWSESQRKAGRLCLRWLTLMNGRVIGSAYVGQTSWFPKTTKTLYVAVHPDHQDHGHGRALLERAEGTASERGGTTAFTWTEESWPRSMQFLNRAGYEIVERRWESTLDLMQCDPAELQRTVDHILSTGIRLVSVSSLSSEGTNWKRDLHRLYADVEQDIPAPFPLPELQFDDFKTVVLGRRFVGEGFVVALDGGSLIGLSEPQPVDDVPRMIEQRLTGVRSDYRGRGIALALKAQIAMWAMRAGYTTIRTQNAASNAAMLAVNKRLGFVQNRATVEYLKDL